jgi:hypothetical protein
VLSRVFSLPARQSGLSTPGRPLLDLASRSECSSDPVSPVSLARPRLAVGPFLGLAVLMDRTPPHAYACDDASLRVRPPSRVLTARPSRADQAASSSPELRFPTAHEGSEVHFTRALPARFVPPSGFGYPPGGLLPPSPCRPFFVPTALLGFPLRSVPLPESRTAFPPHSHPPAVSSERCSWCETPSRHAGPRLLGFVLSESP